jgi:hypothetical protein
MVFAITRPILLQQRTTQQDAERGHATEGRRAQPAISSSPDVRPINTFKQQIGHVVAISRRKTPELFKNHPP